MVSTHKHWITRWNFWLLIRFQDIFNHSCLNYNWEYDINHRISCRVFTQLWPQCFFFPVKLFLPRQTFFFWNLYGHFSPLRALFRQNRYGQLQNFYGHFFKNCYGQIWSFTASITSRVLRALFSFTGTFRFFRISIFCERFVASI